MVQTAKLATYYPICNTMFITVQDKKPLYFASKIHCAKYPPIVVLVLVVVEVDTNCNVVNFSVVVLGLTVPVVVPVSKTVLPVAVGVDPVEQIIHYNF